jgi:hypothetical protein
MTYMGTFIQVVNPLLLLLFAAACCCRCPGPAGLYVDERLAQCIPVSCACQVSALQNLMQAAEQAVTDLNSV